MTAPRPASDFLKQVAASVLRTMRKHGELSFIDLHRKVEADVEHASEPSVRKACRWLRNEHDAPLRYDASRRTWILDRSDFSLPLLDPTPDDIVAVAFAGALVAPLGDTELDARIHSLLMELDERASSGDPSRKLRSHAVTATSSATMPVDPRVVATLATAVGRSVVRITYSSPWRDEPTTKTHTIEPWQLRVHDGSLYVRGWLRSKSTATTFHVSQIQSAVVTGDALSHARPPAHEIWGDGPGKGIDLHHPGRATVRIRGPMARYVALARWHDDQADTWIEPNALLERRFSYDSRRATARRLLALGDALVDVSPPDLRDELARHVAALVDVTADANADEA